MKIVHLISNDKFTNGYINFMKTFMKEYSHSFLFPASSLNAVTIDSTTLVDTQNIIQYVGVDLLFGKKIIELLKEADLIVISGVFGFERIIYSWPKYFFKKVYFHLWGGDFYQVRNKIPKEDTIGYFHRYQLINCFKRSHGLIFLVDREYEVFREITGITKKRNFVAPMPEDVTTVFQYKKYQNHKLDDGIIRILLGNSATQTNHHKEALRYLAHFKENNILIICPLSYGDKKYAEEIEKYGTELFGKKINFLKTILSKNDYYKILSKCDIGVFNNDRQQAMGNIHTLLMLGKKVYMRTDITSYSYFSSSGFIVNDILSLESESISDLVSFKGRENNIKIANSTDYFEIARNQWKYVFDSICNN